MESRTKYRQSFGTIREMVERAYGAGEVPDDPSAVSEFERGWFSAVYGVRLRSGRDVVLKVAPEPHAEVLTYERDLMRNELAALRVIAEHVPVVVPRVEFAADAGDVVGAAWFTMTRIPGANLGDAMERGLDGVRTADLMAQLGAANRRLNDVVGPAFGSIHRAGHATWRGAFEELIADLLADAERAAVPLGPLADGIRRAVERLAPALEEVRTPRLVEWDLWPGNALAADGSLTGIVDHERALWGDPLMEAGFMNDDIPIFPAAEHFLRGYGPVDPSPGATARRRLYGVHRLLVMTVEPAFRGPQDPHQSRWSRGLLEALVDELRG